MCLRMEKLDEIRKNTLKLKKLVSGTAKENLPSVRLLDRLGFVAIGLESYELALN